MRRYIDNLNFEIRLLSLNDREIIKNFTTGSECPEKFIGDHLRSEQVFTDMDEGDAVTYIVVNNITESLSEIVSYFSLVSSSLPYYYRDIDDDGNCTISDSLCGIPAIKISMFGVDEKYQDIFYKDEDGDKPVAAWVFEAIISMIDEMAKNTVGIKAIYLHTLPSAKSFYSKNYMKPAGDYFYPLKCEDDNLEVMYAFIREVKGLNGK